MATPKSYNTTSFCSDCAEDAIIYCAPIRDHQVPEFLDSVFAKTSPKRSFSMTENERFRLVFAKIAWVYKFGHRNCCIAGCREDTQRQMLIYKQSTCDQLMTWQEERKMLRKIKRKNWHSRKSLRSRENLHSWHSRHIEELLKPQKLTLWTNVAPWHARGTYWTRASYCQWSRTSPSSWRNVRATARSVTWSRGYIRAACSVGFLYFVETASSRLKLQDIVAEFKDPVWQLKPALKWG